MEMKRNYRSTLYYWKKVNKNSENIKRNIISCLVRGLFLFLKRFTASQRFSIGLRSGESAGQRRKGPSSSACSKRSMVRSPRASHHCIVSFARCPGAPSSTRTELRSWDMAKKFCLIFPCGNINFPSPCSVEWLLFLLMQCRNNKILRTRTNGTCNF